MDNRNPTSEYQKTWLEHLESRTPRPGGPHTTGIDTGEVERRLRESPFFQKSQFVRQAADTIAALREKLEAAQRRAHILEEGWRIADEGRIEAEAAPSRDEALRAENKRLRAALTIIRDARFVEASYHRSVARAALEGRT